MLETSRRHSELLIGSVVLCLLMYFPFFLHLGSLPIRTWDEARLAVNAFEMYKNGNYLVTFFDGSPDMWNTKPPLLIWIQVFFFKVIGPGELAVRLPSAIAAFLTASSLVLFSFRYLKDFWFGFIAAMVLVTSYGYVNVHASRSGDYDALLTLFTTLLFLSYFLFLEKEDKKYLHLFFICIVLAILTKSIQGLIFLPALFIYQIISRKVYLIMNKWFFIDLILCVGIISMYYLLRENNNPGYLKAVWMNELGGRYTESLENHKEDFMFYYNSLIGKYYSSWYWLVPCGIITGFLYKDDKIRRLTLMTTIVALTYWLIISLSETKLNWYQTPIFPLLALIVVIPIYYLFTFLKHSTYNQNIFRMNVIPFVFLFIVFLRPYEIIIDKVYFPKEDDPGDNRLQINFYMKDVLRAKHSLKNYYLCYEGYNAQLIFYLNLLNDKDQKINFRDWNKLKAGDLVLASQSMVQDSIENKYSFELTDTIKNIKKYKINGTKQIN